ncbi:flagellin [Kamptonema cortianum]|nr:flagellin [Geitlerinema splendidum]MDK3158809.1 flagellin [Kamptonema cortianum]
MSLRINTNVPAMTALRQIAISESKFQGSVTRLSTGLRINSAGDDPAGMIISEGLRSQIKGLQQAIKNSQDAINMTKTAEGALDEVSRLLLSIRALAVSSANTAVVDFNQLQANQTQIRNVVQSLNRIAEHTTWGQKPLLNGASGTVTNVTTTNLVASAYIGSNFGGETVRTGPVTMQRVQAATQTSTGALATTFANGNAPVNAGTFAINGVAFTVDAGESVTNVLTKINAKSAQTGVSASFVDGSGITLTSMKYGSNFPIHYVETSTILNGGNSATPAVGNNAIYTVTVPVEPSPATTSETFTGGQGPGVDGLTLSSPSGNRLVITTAGNATSALTTFGGLTVGDMRFQIGSNASQFTTFGMPSVFASDLGKGAVTGQSVATLDVTTQQGATDAIAIIDSAIQEMALIRGNLGSFQQNFLESTVRSLGIAEENMVASESQIRDADMAFEMTEYTKLNILRQSGMAVLAQASQAPQNVLQLLRGG